MTNDALAVAKPYANGDVIADKYALEELLGRGGMGAVWRARNLALDAPVAIKLLNPEGDRAALGGRLLVEARAAAKISHPAIVKVFDVGQTARREPFIVMELLSGTSLGALLQVEHRLPATRAVQLLLPIADALVAAHRKGLVHRDVKPDNIFLADHEGSLQPKLVDFGIVKVAEHDRQLQLTRAGAVMGSPDYLSPEQARGVSDIDHQSDVWSFCVVLFEAIAGRMPFLATNYNALLTQIVDASPPALHEVASVDEQLSAIVARGLAKDRAERFQSMNALGQALARWLLDRGVAEDICGTALEAKWLQGGEHDRRAKGDVWLPEARSGVRLAVNVRRAETEPGRSSPLPKPARKRGRFWLALVSVTALLGGSAAFALTSFSRPAPDPPALGERTVTPLPPRSVPPQEPSAAAGREWQPEPLAIEQLPLEPAPSVRPAAPHPTRRSPSISRRPRSAAPSVRKQHPTRDLLRPY